MTLAIVTANLTAFIAAMAVGQGDPLLYGLNLGVAGVGLYLFVRGVIHSNSELNVYKEQNARLWEVNERLMNATNNSALPAILKSTEVVRETARRGSGLNTDQLTDLVNRLEELAGNGDHT